MKTKLVEVMSRSPFRLRGKIVRAAIVTGKQIGRAHV